MVFKKICFAILSILLFSDCQNKETRMKNDAKEYIAIIKNTNKSGEVLNSLKGMEFWEIHGIMMNKLANIDVISYRISICQKYTGDDFRKFSKIFENTFKEVFEIEGEDNQMVNVFILSLIVCE
jgi:histidinol phosphatase-like enzyme